MTIDRSRSAPASPVLTRLQQVKLRRTGVLDYRVGVTERSFTTVIERLYWCKGFLAEEQRYARREEAERKFNRGNRP